MEVLYKPGQWNSISDMLSRLETDSTAAQAGYLETAVLSLDIRKGRERY